jgi:tRNA pseudouridine38-40 synthase
METTLKGRVRYDGTRFAGWQRQRHARSVQGEIEAALTRIARRPISIQGAARTDAGVHALGQVFSCTWPGTPPPRLRHALSQLLAPEIRVDALETAPPGFNARFDAIGKCYGYAFEVAKEADPLAAPYAWHVHYDIDFDRLRACLPLLRGTHDFAGFQSTGSQLRHTTVRTLHRIALLPGPVIGPCDNPRLWRLEIEGNGFLYHMVRNLVGSLIEIARGRFPLDFIEAALASPGPFRGYCAPAQGLVLMEVYYGQPPTHWNLGDATDVQSGVPATRKDLP